MVAEPTDTPVARQISTHAVTQAILSAGPTSRADLAKRTGLSKQTISDVVRALEDEGWLRPLGRTSGKPGRSAILYEINARAALCAVIDLGGTKVSVAIGDLLGDILAEGLEETDPRGGRHVVDQIARQVRDLSGRVGLAKGALRLAVLGTPGVFHPETGRIEVAPNVPGLGEIDVPQLLRAAIGARVVIENDVNLAARGEQWRGHGAGMRNFVFIALGTGIGMGIIADGRLLRGARGAAGEIGYLPIGGDPYNPAGFALGTLETAVGSVAIAERYAGYGGRPGTVVRDIFGALGQGDGAAAASLEETARLLAPAIAAVAATLDPQVVILGGSIGARPEMLDLIRHYLPRCTPYPPPVEISVLGSRATLIGALAVAVERMHDELFGVALTAGAAAPGARPTA
ncbi:MAG: ROK family transcriptional regulator [Devosia sp.]